MNAVILELQILKGEVYLFYEIVSIAVIFKFVEMFLWDSSFLLKLVFALHKCRDTFKWQQYSFNPVDFSTHLKVLFFYM